MHSAEDVPEPSGVFTQIAPDAPRPGNLDLSHELQRARGPAGNTVTRSRLGLGEGGFIALDRRDLETELHVRGRRVAQATPGGAMERWEGHGSATEVWRANR